MLSFINSDCDLQRSEAYEIGLEFILVSWSDIIQSKYYTVSQLHKAADKKKISIYSIGRRIYVANYVVQCSQNVYTSRLKY